MSGSNQSAAVHTGGKSAFRQLRLDGVSRQFAGQNALHKLSLDIERGEFIALLGPSGCGKSTALNCIAGLLSLTEGGIWLDDKRIDTLPPERRGFGMVFQNYALFPHLSVARNIGFGLKMRNLPAADIERRVAGALAAVQLDAHAHKLPGQLSGGQQQRVAIARAIVIEPPLILMDEPLSNLDARLRIEMRSEIRRIHSAQGCSTIYVTHDQDEALAMADRVVVMRLGEVQQVGSPQEVFGKPATLDVARFMGYRNVLSARLVSAVGPQLLVEGPQGLRLQATGMEPLHGDAVTLAIRPDDIEIGEAAHAFDGTVVTAEYGGREWLLQVKTAFAPLLFVRAPRGGKPGDAVRLHIAPERVLAYAQEGSA